MYCLPSPSRAPSPVLNSSRSCLSGSLRRSMTGEVRSTQTRAPASTAGCAAACQSRVTEVSSESPRLSDSSVSTSSPRSP